jgi:type II restriction/modification system DNA methylase subunit YeeA
MQTAPGFRTNRDLFSNHYLDEHLPGSDPWQSVDSTTLQQAYENITDLWERERDLVADRNESQLEEKFIRPMFRELGIPFEVEESVRQGQRRPDYGFFESDEESRNAFTRRRNDGDFYQNAVAVADAKRWGRKLDTRGERQRDFENPSYQIHVYLQETPTTWAVLTNGRYWRLYYGPTSHRLDSYYEIDLQTVLETGDREAFKYFYLFFRHKAFLPDASGDCFLDDVYNQSNIFAQELGEDLQDNIYEAIRILAEGFLTYPDNDLGVDDLERIHDSSLIYLYRLIFVLYAESEGRDLLNTDNEIYRTSYSLNTIKQEVAEELDSTQPRYQSWQDTLWNRIDELFQLIDLGSVSHGIPEDELHIPAYNGGLFRTNPDEEDSCEAQFLATYTVGDEYLAQVIELLTRSQTGSEEKIFVDYSSLDVRHLGRIYERLLEYKLNIADEPLTLDNDEYVVANAGDDIVVEPEAVYLTTDSGERKATGSYYTPEYVVEYIVENTLEPLVTEIREDLVGSDASGKDGFAEEFAQRIFELKVLDPAMGSGHFLTNAVDYLAREIIDVQGRQAKQQGIETVDPEHDINWARRQVAQRCIYGVDLNPLAVELAKVSLWLRTLAAEKPLAFLDHHLKTGNSLVGSDIEEIGAPKNEKQENRPESETSLSQYIDTRQGTIEQLMRIYQDFIAIENQEPADVKEMEAKYDEFERNKLRQRLEAMANVQTAEDFNLDNIPGDAYEQMAAAVEDDDKWTDIEQRSWFQDAQNRSENSQYFHWHLEYPEVFYGTSGKKKSDGGFDAVIGNPPWISFGLRGVDKLPEDEKSYYKSQFDDSAEYKISTYALFIESGIRLTKKNGRHGYIVPDSFLIGQYFSKVRSYMLEQTEIKEINLVLEDFWESDIGRSLVYIVESDLEPNHENIMNISLYDTLDEFTAAQGKTNQYPQSFFHQTELKRFRLLFDSQEKDLIEQIEKAAELTVGDVMSIHTGIRSRIGQKNIQSKEREGETWQKGIVSSAQVVRYDVSWENHYLNIDPELLWSGGWDKEVIEQPKILIRQTGDRIIAGLDTEGLYHLNNLHSAVLESERIDIRYMLSLLNSNLLFRYYTLVTLELGRSMAQTDIEMLLKLPVKDVDFNYPEDQRTSLVEDCLNQIYEGISRQDMLVPSILKEEIHAGNLGIAHDVICKLSYNTSELVEKREEMNIDISDYIRDYDKGRTLGELSEYQPHQAIHESILAETTETKEGLQIGSVTVENKGLKTLILANARYKPENSGEYETDRWGYTSTEMGTVMEFINLNEEKKALVNEFVPFVVNETDDGYAEFRSSATKTNSIIDRLEALRLPVHESVERGLDQYLERKEEYEEIERKIGKIDRLIDMIIYMMYGLTRAEIQTIEGK